MSYIGKGLVSGPSDPKENNNEKPSEIGSGPGFLKRQFDKKNSSKNILGSRSRISSFEVKRSLEGKYGSQEMRRDLAKRLGISNPWDPRVSGEIKKIEDRVKDYSKDGFITAHEVKKSLGDFKNASYWEEKHLKEERMADGKITKPERIERERKKIRDEFIRDAFGIKE